MPEVDGPAPALTVNGATIETSLERLDAPADPLHFSFWRDRPSWWFSATADLSAVDADARGYVFTAARPGQSAPMFAPGMDYVLPPCWKDCLETWPAPPLEGIVRTNPHLTDRAGSDGEAFHRAGHFFTGYSSLWHLEHAAQTHGGGSLKDRARILDWGCGAGRLTQHLTRNLPGEIHGVDIDADNIVWAQANIPSVHFQTVDLDLPTPFPDGHFDAAIGMSSVFTHLSEDDQFRWLEEHRRILKPGGLLLMTIAAESSLKRAAQHKMIRYAREMRRRGISDSDIPPLFESMLGERTDYYRNTRHATDYVYAKWRRYFDIAGIERGGSLGQQDIVVALRR